MKNLQDRLQSLEQQAEDAGNVLMPWPEWRRYVRMTPEEKRAYIEDKLRTLVLEIVGREGMTS